MTRIAKIHRTEVETKKNKQPTKQVTKGEGRREKRKKDDSNQENENKRQKEDLEGMEYPQTQTNQTKRSRTKHKQHQQWSSTQQNTEKAAGADKIKTLNLRISKLSNELLFFYHSQLTGYQQNENNLDRETENRKRAKNK